VVSQPFSLRREVCDGSLRLVTAESVSAPILAFRGRTNVSFDLRAIINVALSRYLSCTNSTVQVYMHVWREEKLVLSLLLMLCRSYTSTGSAPHSTAKAAKWSQGDAHATYLICKA
jgi:hypothetical protein